VRQVVVTHAPKAVLEQAGGCSTPPCGTGAASGVLVEPDVLGEKPHRGQAGGVEEALRAERAAEEEVVVEVDEVLGEVGHPCAAPDSIACELKSAAPPGGRIAAWSTDETCGWRGVQPAGHLAGGHQVDRRTHGANRWMLAQRVAQLVAETNRACPLDSRVVAVPDSPASRSRRAWFHAGSSAVHPGVDDIDRERCTRARSAPPSAAGRHGDSVDRRC
jgi:hypothetical protein